MHGDDFTFVGKPTEMKRMKELMESWYGIKVRAVLGDGEGDAKSITLLNRIIRWTKEEVQIEADPKHEKKIRACFGISDDSNGLESPCTKGEDRDDGEERLGKVESKEFRAVAARANYLGADRADLQFAVKEACRGMANPTAGDMAKMKRIARYVKSVPRVMMRAGTQAEDVGIIVTYVDSDWAGCRSTRRSTSGGAMTVGGMVVRSWSTTQATIATSSGEAEYYALVRGSAESLGLQSALRDIGYEMKVEVRVDSSAAKAIASRLGLGRTRHLEVRFLWVQEAVRRGRLRIKKVLGKTNPADAMTKPMSRSDMMKVLEPVGILHERSRIRADET